MRRLTLVIQTGTLYGLLLLLPVSKAAVEIAFPVLLLTWLVQHAPTRWQASVWRLPATRPCLVALLGYLAVCAASILTSSYPSLSLRGFICKTLEYALYFIVMADLATDTAVARRGLIVLACSSVVVALDAFAQQAIGYDPLLRHQLQSAVRITGPYENSIDLGTFLAVVIPIVAMRFASSAGVRRGGWAAVLLLQVGCLALTRSEGAVLVLLAGFTLVAAVFPRWTRRLAWTGLAVAALAAVTVVSTEAFSVKAEFAGVHDRLDMWRAGWRMVEARPIMGHGLNTFMANYLTYWVGGERQPRYAHNCFLQVAAETGLMGLTAFVFVLGSMVRVWWRACRRFRETSSQWVLVGVFGGLMGFLLQSFFDTNFYALRQAALFWVLAGLLTGSSALALPSTASDSAPSPLGAV